MTDDEAIIARVLRGDSEAFRALVDRYQGPVVRMIAHLTCDTHARDDVAQDVFLAAYRSLARFDPARSSFSTWLFTIARNKAINAAKRRRQMLIGSFPEPQDPRVPSDDLMVQELHARLDRALARLPSHQRRAFVMAEFDDLPYETIAQIEAVRVGTVRSRINRAKAALRSLLGDAGANH